MLYVVFVKGRRLLTASMPETTQAQLLGGTVFAVAPSCGAPTASSHILFPLCASVRFAPCIDEEEVKGDHTGRERILRRTAPSLDSWTDLLLLQPNPAGASSLVPSVPLWWDREGRRSGLCRLLDLCLSVFFFPPLCTLKRCSITACPQEGVCFGSRDDLIDEGRVEAAALGLLLMGSENTFYRNLSSCLCQIQLLTESQVHFPQER